MLALSGTPSENVSVPMRVSSLSGIATPGGMGVECLYCGFAGGPESICAIAAVEPMTKKTIAASRTFNFIHTSRFLLPANTEFRFIALLCRCTRLSIEIYTIQEIITIDDFRKELAREGA